MNKVWLYNGHCGKILTRFAEASIDAVVTDPPYMINFAGEKWDAIKQAQEWIFSWSEELFRVMKPGAHLLAFGGTRTEHHLKLGLELVGFVIMDTLVWLHGQGLPKNSQDLSPVPGFEGYGTGLRPCWEPIIWAMKPFSGKYLENAKKAGVAGLNISGCLLTDAGEVRTYFSGKKRESSSYNYQGANEKGFSDYRPGRWPPNVILDDVAAEMLDLQVRKQEGPEGVSRFYYKAKSPARERHADVDGDRIENDHPTVKPLGLVQWLLRLVKCPGKCVVLDPFLGSGTTAIAALREGCSCIGIDEDGHYLETADHRIRRDSILNREAVKWVRNRESV